MKRDDNSSNFAFEAAVHYEQLAKQCSHTDPYRRIAMIDLNYWLNEAALREKEGR